MVSYSSHVVIMVLLWSLNPCCSGRWSRTIMKDFKMPEGKEVLILVVVEDGLVLKCV